MMNITKRIEEMVREGYPHNAEIILRKQEDKIEMAQRFEDKGKKDIAENIFESVKEYAQDFDNRFITPATVKVGDGVTMHMYSDANAGTIIKVTKTTITVQQDFATIDPNFKPKMYAGGFAGHCYNQNEQTYTYEPNPNGRVVTFKWSEKFGRYQNKKVGLTITKGRREFYDYNF